MLGYLENAFAAIRAAVSQLTFRDIIDMLLLALVIYQLIKVTRETRANQVLKGLAIVLVGSLVASWLSLRGISWLLHYIIETGPLMLLVIFQPEIRRAFERVGRGKIFEITSVSTFDYEAAASVIVRAALNMSKRHVGAFIVLQGKAGLEDIIESGTRMEALLSAELLENIFEPGTPLHDGAVIIRSNRIVAAGCFSPTTMRTDLPQDMGARHRAAIGLSENADATAIVVSEETGIISIAYNSSLTRNLDASALKKRIIGAYSHAGAINETRGFRAFFKRGNRQNEADNNSME